MKIINKFNNQIIFEDNSSTIKATVLNALKSEVNLWGANLSEADLSGAYLSGANLSGANLLRANLSGADLLRANLSGANLSRANLSEANLSGADLSGANLSGANLSGANLSRADLSGANLSFTGLFGFYLFKHFGYAWKNKNNEIIVKIGCKELTLNDWLKEYKNIGENESYSELDIKNYGNMLKFIKVNFK